MTDAPMKATTALSFSEALRALKQGSRVARSGWNGKGMWLKFVEARDYKVDALGDSDGGSGQAFLRDAPSMDLLPWIGMKTADDKFVPWLCSQTDMLAEDWEVANE